MKEAGLKAISKWELKGNTPEDLFYLVLLYFGHNEQQL